MTGASPGAPGGPGLKRVKSAACQPADTGGQDHGASGEEEFHRALFLGLVAVVVEHSSPGGAHPALVKPFVESDPWNQNLAVAWFKGRQFPAAYQLAYRPGPFVPANCGRFMDRHEIIRIVIHSNPQWCGQGDPESSAKFVNHRERLLKANI
jgi:hypothetical protein